MRVAFYAPLKAPTHPAPSGDRRMARQLMAALRHAGHTVDVASDLRSFESAGDTGRQTVIREAAESEAANIIARLQVPAVSRPEIWFTYHLYYKAPDWIGPAVCAALGLGYVVAEASYAPKRARGPWASGHEATANALRTADSVLALTKRDIPCIEPLLADQAELFYLPPFFDPGGNHEAENGREHRESRRMRFADRLQVDPGKHWLLAVGMMRLGDKLESYRRLTGALRVLSGDDWQLVIVGDGEARAEVEAAFSSLGNTQNGGFVAWAGELSQTDLHDIYRACDIFVWPAVNEAYGMAILEAQAAGLPVVAGNDGGVADVVRDGETALLVAPGDPIAFSERVRALLDDSHRRRELGDNGVRFVLHDRSLSAASAVVDRALRHACDIRHETARHAS